VTDHPEDFSVGVEEEYQLIDAETGDLRPASAAVLSSAAPALGEEVQPELLRSQIEIASPVCRSLGEVAAQVTRLRRSVAEAAAAQGCRLGAAGTHPFATWDHQQFTAKPRYLDLAEEFQQTARDTLIFGCHVHVGIADEEVAIDIMNRVRPWLAVLVALGANSPFWAGADTGYASYRTEVFRRFPMTGTPHRFEGRADYDRVVATLVATEAITDATKLYWDVRPSARFPTLEFRVSDVCLRVEEAVAITGLVRSLAQAAHADAQAARPTPGPRPEVLEAAVWRAARYGLDGDLIDTLEGRSRPAREMVGALLALARPSLEEAGDWELVSAAVERLLVDGTGARRQREAFARRGDLGDVVALVVDETLAGA